MAPIISHLESARDLATSLTSSLFSRRDNNANNYNPGDGVKMPDQINNHAFFGLFAILGAAMVLATIWFFFWAKNGGFVWRKTDWDDYKSTVLRRKGPDGKTLSNATKSTRLGQQTIRGTFSDYAPSEKLAPSEYGYPNPNRKQKKSRPHTSRRRGPSDDDVRAYRHEKPALVGGLNRNADGSHFDYTNSDRSDYASNLSAQPLRPKPAPAKKKGFMEKSKEKRQAKKQEKEMRQVRNNAAKKQDILLGARRQSIIETSTIADSEDTYDSDKGYKDKDTTYYSAYRPPQPAYADRRQSPRRSSPRRESPYHSRPTSANHSRQASPTKRASRPHGGYAYSDAGSDHGYKGYPQSIPD